MTKKQFDRLTHHVLNYICFAACDIMYALSVPQWVSEDCFFFIPILYGGLLMLARIYVMQKRVIENAVPHEY